MKKAKNKEYLFFVAMKDCLFCGKTPAGYVHHIRYGTTCGVGTKPADKRSIPLCYEHHDLVHNDPRLFHLTVTREDIWKAMFEQLLEWLEKSDVGKGRELKCDFCGKDVDAIRCYDCIYAG